MKIVFVPERETKRTWRFAEDILQDEEPQIGTIYIRKATLKFLGWQPGDPIVIDITRPT